MGKWIWGVAGSIALLVIGFGLNAYHDNLKSQISELKSDLKHYQLSEPFFTKIPARANLILRNIKVDLQSGNSFTFASADRIDLYTVEFSKVVEHDKDHAGNALYSVQFRINGFVGGNRFQNVYSEPLEIVPGNISKPALLVKTLLYIYVDSVSLGHVYLSVATAPSNLRKSWDMSFNSYRNHQTFVSSEELKEPLMTTSPSHQP